MSKIYGLEAEIELSKAGVAGDTAALEAISQAYQLVDMDEDSVVLTDIDEQHCLLKVDFYIDDRPNGNATDIGHLIDVVTPHATKAFRVSGENEDCGRFEDVQGPLPGIIDQALEVGREYAQEALPERDLHSQVDEAMRYCGHDQAQAVSHLVRLLRTNEDLLPEGIAQLIEPTLSQLEEVDEQPA